MRVLLDATGLGSGAGGDETMLSGVLQGLAEVAGVDDVFPVLAADGVELPDPVHRDPRFPVQRVRRLPGALHFTTTLPRAVAACTPRPDLVFSATHGPVRSAVPVALMVQDLSFEHRPQDYPPLTRRRLQWAVRSQVHGARVVLTVSDHARSDLLRTYRLDPSRVFTVPNANLPAPPVSERALADARSDLRVRGVDGPFLLYLGNLHPRKNVGTIIEAFARARSDGGDLDGHRLVIAGGRWWGTGEEEVARRLAPEGSVLFLGRVDETEREVLLRDASALCYVSLFEGFGLPPLEAMARGTAVIASDRTSVPEVVGDAAEVVDPLDVEAVAAAMRRIVTDEDRVAELRERGLRRAAHYSVRNTGRALFDAFASAIGQPWTRPLPERRDEVAMAVGRERGSFGRVVDTDAEDVAGQTERLVATCDSLTPGEIALVRVPRPRSVADRLRSRSADRLWRTVEAHDCVVLDSWSEPDGADLLVLRRVVV